MMRWGQIDQQHYNSEGIEADYPYFVSGADKDKLAEWNRIIVKDFIKILGIYTINSFPEAEPSPTGVVPVILTIRNEIKKLDDQYFSVFYTAEYSSRYSAHPTELVYTTNIDLNAKKRVALSDLVRVDEDFVRDFRNWEVILFEPGNEELNQAVMDYLASLEDDMLLGGFQRADIIGSSNYLGIFSYLTFDSLGISLEVPNYLGDHMEFERKFTELTDFLK
ncbi:MAG TPA: hypothetical protein VJ888_02570 [Mobilitalea sp.]|nr:hypothetical protein [Mobilitalea sp.]